MIVDLACLFVLILGALTVSLPRYRAGMDWGDEGFLAYGGVRVMQGQLPHRDFVSLQPPLSFYVAAVTFKLLGTSLVSLRTLGLSIHLLIPLLIYACGRNFMPSLVAFAAAVPAIVLGIPAFNFVPYAVWQGITVTLAAATLYIYALRSERTGLALLAGMLTGLSIFLRHDQGVYLAISIIALTLALRSTKTSSTKNLFVSWCAGLAIITFGCAAYWWATGALPEMFRQLIVFPFATYRITSSEPFPRFSWLVSVQQNSFTLLYYLPIVLIAFAIGWLGRQIWRRAFSWNEIILTFLTAWSALFYCQVLTRSDPSHLLITLPPLFLLIAFGWHIVAEKLAHTPKVKTSLSILFAVVAVGYLWTIGRLILPPINHTLEVLDVSRGRVRVENAAWTTDLIRRIQQAVPPERSILALPYQPMFYFLCERRNPTRWNYLWPGDQTVKDHEELIQQAKSDPPAMAFVSNEDEMTSYAPDILDYIHRDYTPGEELGDLTVYVPRQTMP